MHIPVLKKEAIQLLDVKPNQNFIDATCGEGGHLTAILESSGPGGKVLGIERDPEAVKKLKLKIKNFQKRTILVCGNYADLKKISEREKFEKIDGILFDLGLSSWHLEEAGRGFSFKKKEPLDMRYNPQNPLSVQKVINYWSSSDLAGILREYGEERFADKIAEEIISTRKIKAITNTLQLVEAIGRAVPGFYKRQNIHFATKTFQALRIAVNQELDNLKSALPQALDILGGGGRMVLISFHSLEDRIVKNFFKEKSREGELDILTKKPVVPSWLEIKSNHRSRSAKMRAAKKINK